MTEAPAPYPVEPAPAPPSADSSGQAPKFQQILAALQARYPHCFFAADTDPKPLKIGIHKDLAARGELPEAITATRLRNFLAWYVRRYRYRKALINGGPRVDLDGNPAGELTEEHSLAAKESLKSKVAPGSPRAHLPVDSPLTPENTVPGKLEVTIKFNELPTPVQVQSGYKFGLDCDGRTVAVTLRPKHWNKLTAAAAEYPQWVAALTGKIGELQGKGFVLEQPSLQVFEKKSKVQEGADTGVQEPTADTTPPQAASTPPPAAPAPAPASPSPVKAKPAAASPSQAEAKPAAAKRAAAAKPAAPKKPKLSLKR